MKRALAILLMCLLVADAAPAAPGMGWWRGAWAHRRRVTVPEFKPTGWEGDEVAVVTMPTAGKTHADGGDIRVVTFRGKERPRKVLSVGPGDVCRVAFALQPGVTDYYAYFGCETPPTPAEELDLRRGLLLQAWLYPGGGIGNLAEARKVLNERVTRYVGADFVDRVFHGHTLFGPDRRVARRYTGYLKCPADGEYVFVLSSMNASFLLIDDELVVDNGGWHPPQRDIRVKGKVTLRRGLHKLTVLHISGKGHPVVVAAWKPPGQKRVTVIPPAAFTSVTRARPGPMSDRGEAYGADFQYDHAGEAYLDERYYQRYTFRARPYGRLPREVEWTWDFGDGQTATGAEPRHVYLTEGMYTVTLRGKLGAKTLERTNRIWVSRPWRLQARDETEPAKRYAELVAEYDFAKLPDAALAEAVLLLDSVGNDAGVIRAGAALVARERIDGESARAAMDRLAEALREAGRPEEAVAVLERAAGRVANPAVAAELLVWAGRVMLDDLREPDGAERRFRRALEEYAHVTTAPPIRQARIGLGDVHLARGERDKAAAAYEEAGRGRLGGRSPLVARGSFARQIEAWIREGEFAAAEEKLEQWADTLPADRLGGYLTLMRVRLLTARKRHADAAYHAVKLVNANPGSTHAPELLKLAAEARHELGESERVDEILRRIVREYPESPLAGKAAKLLADR